MNVKEITTNQIKDYIRQERANGREMEEIVKELLENLDDIILLFNDDATAEQQIRELAERDKKKKKWRLIVTVSIDDDSDRTKTTGESMSLQSSIDRVYGEYQARIEAEIEQEEETRRIAFQSALSQVIPDEWQQELRFRTLLSSSDVYARFEYYDNMVTIEHGKCTNGNEWRLSIDDKRSFPSNERVQTFSSEDFQQGFLLALGQMV